MSNYNYPRMLQQMPDDQNSNVFKKLKSRTAIEEYIEHIVVLDVREVLVNSDYPKAINSCHVGYL